MSTYGIVYILSGGNLGPGFYKVGKSTREVSLRIRELNSETTNTAPFKSEGYVIVTDIDAVEKLAHNKLMAFRINPRREFFKADLQDIISAVREASEGFVLNDNLPMLKSNSSFSNFNDTVENAIITKKHLIVPEKHKKWQDVLKNLENVAAIFLEKISANPHLSELSLIDNIAEGHALRMPILELFSDSAVIKQDWWELCKAAGYSNDQVQEARLLFAIGFWGKIINIDPKAKNAVKHTSCFPHPPEGIFYYITHEIDWDTRYYDLPSSTIRLCPLSGYGKNNIFKKEHVGGHALTLRIDLAKGDHELAFAKHLANNLHVTKVHAGADPDAVISSIDYDDLLTLAGSNIYDLWKKWPKFQIKSPKMR